MHLQSTLPAMVATGGNGDGLGMGGGLIGGLVLGSLLRNGGLGGLGGTDVGVTQASLAAQLANVTDTLQNTTVMQTLGSIQASVPLAEAQVQLALAGATSDIRSHIGAVENTLTQGQMAIQQNVSNAIASSLASQNNILTAVLTTGAAGISATKDAQFAITTATRDEGDKTRALIESINLTNLNRELGVAQAALLEERAVGRSREVEVNVSQSVNQNQNQLNLQQQQQQQMQILANLAAGINNLAGDIQAVRQTQSNVNFGVQGNAAQTASAANNRVN